jgi:transcriptional regulator with XRE-family HTH domain
MQNFADSDANYSSELVNDLLRDIKPEDQEQTDYKMKLAAKIYAALKSKGWKSLQLAESLNLKSPSLVSKWLSGTHNFTVDTLVDIQRVLGIRLIDDEPAETTAKLNTSFRVSAKSHSLNKDIFEHLQKITGESGDLKATIVRNDY